VEKNLIDRYIQDKLSEEERKEVELLFLETETNQYLYESLENDFNRIIVEKPEHEIRIDNILERIKSEKGMVENDTEPRHRTISKFIRAYSRIAAVLLIPLLIASFILIRNRTKVPVYEEVVNSIYAPMGSRISFTLPDGTKGMLNSGSTITYSLPFSDNRKLKLTGEGWFDVQKDEKHPFVISALNTTFTVVGTTFNLSAYEEENYVELVLTTGRVECLDKSKKEKVIVLPSERLVFKDGKIIRSVTDTTKYNGWTKGKLIFRGDAMDEVVRRIMRWYNVDIELADKELENYSFRGIFSDDSIEDILAFLAMTSPISYSIVPPSLNQDGSVSKEKVIISLSKR